MALILGIETSCDETAAAVVEDGRRILSNVVSSQVDLHRKYGGVVPELASRAHIERIVPVVREAVGQAALSFDDLDVIAVTRGPGLIGALLVGVNYAKALAFSLGRPLIGVNHLEGHIHACLLEEARKDGSPAKVEYPAVALVVSGGHTSLYRVDHRGEANGFPFRYALVGRTLDDAAGEAYDKVAKLLGLGYPGGPILDRLAATGDPAAYRFTRPKIKSGRGFDFSFSGIKTAVVRLAENGALHAETAERLRRRQSGSSDEGDASVGPTTRDLAASFQHSVVAELSDKTMAAAEEFGARSVFLTGGVAANSLLRSILEERCRAAGLSLYRPTIELSTDNAAMIAAAAFPRWEAGERADARMDAAASLPLGTELAD